MKSIVKIAFTNLLSCCLITTIPVIAAPKTDVITATVIEITSIKNPKQQLDAIMKLGESGKSQAFILTVLLKLPATVLELIFPIISDDIFLSFTGIERSIMKKFDERTTKLQSYSDELCKKEFGESYQTMVKLLMMNNLIDLGIKLFIKAVTTHPLKSIHYNESHDKCLINSAELKTFVMYLIDLYQNDNTFSLELKTPLIVMWKSTIEQFFPKENIPVDLLEYIMAVMRS